MATATATGVVTYGDLSTVEGRTFYELKLLRVATPNFLHIWFGQQGAIFPVTILPENTGAIIQWNKPTAFTAVTTALTENVVPAGQDLTMSSDTATVDAYGAYVKYTKKMAEFGKMLAELKPYLINLGKAVMPTHTKQALAVQVQRLSNGGAALAA